MVFSSITFLYYFLPPVVLLYFLVPAKLKNIILLISSFIFYAWGEPRYVILMAIDIILSYISGLLIERFHGKPLSKIFLIISISICLSFLIFFKYSDFLLENLSKATGVKMPTLNVSLPIGISFYTFQIISYEIDVYRKSANAQRNIIDLAAYISLFPQLVAGPIVRYTDIENQLKKRCHTIENIALGIKLFIIGLSKKILIANTLGELFGAYSASYQHSIIFSWISAVSYALQIYFDFSGYSDMAIGIGKIFGFDFCKNFNYPYISKSITEFWRRWHISLGSWFRDYVYIPLGGNRTGKIKWLRNILIVWLLTGLWHGASWNFVIWGLYFAVFLIIEKLFLVRFLDKHKILSHIYVILTVLISFVIFSSEDIKNTVRQLIEMFGFNKVPIITAEHSYYIRSYFVVLVIAIIGATPFPKWILKKISITKAAVIIEPVILALLILLCTSYIVDGSFNPFLYFRF